MVNPCTGLHMARKSQEWRKLEAREAELAARVQADQKELDEIRIARRVLARMSGVDGDDDDPQDAPAEGSNLTIGELALSLIRDAGEEGMTSNTILERLQNGPAPSLVRTSLSPPLSRLKKKGIIRLDGEHWKLAASNGEQDGDPSA